MTVPSEPQLPVRHSLNLPAEAELGVFADFAHIWHTPATFVLDFLSVKVPASAETTEDGAGAELVISSRVAARVRIPPEQIFPLIEALRTQGQEWLNETGRSEPPETWLHPTQPIPSEDGVESSTDAGNASASEGSQEDQG